MDMRKYSGSSFIKVADVEDGPIQMQIAHVREGKFGKPELLGEGGEMVGVNATNNRTLCRAYGNDSDGWIGKEIELYSGEIEYQGDKHPAVLIRPVTPSAPAAKKLTKPTKPTTSERGADYDDEIPY